MAKDRQIFENKIKIKDVIDIMIWLGDLSKNGLIGKNFNKICCSIGKQKIDPELLSLFKD